MPRDGLNRRQAFAAHTAAIGQGGLSALGGIAIQESMLPLAANLRRLILTFHNLLKIFRDPQPVKFTGNTGDTPLSTERERIPMKKRVSSKVNRKKGLFWSDFGSVLPVLSLIK